VNEHHIEENNSILFVYYGNSSFKVHVFSSVGHEKYLSCSKPPSGIFGAVPPRAPCDHHVMKGKVNQNLKVRLMILLCLCDDFDNILNVQKKRCLIQDMFRPQLTLAIPCYPGAV
jgi:hypothetical protein